MLTDIIPAAWRKRVYVAYAALAGILGLVQVLYSTTGTPQPGWLTVTLAVVAFVGASMGSMAGANVNPPILAVDPVVPPTTTLS